MNITDKIQITNEDNMALMARYPDGYFDLAIVDPPYGIGASCGVGLHSRKKFQKANKIWDDKIPNKTYFEELFRVSKNQIICGANYFNEYLYSTKSFICWIKNNPAPNFAEAEYIWTSFPINAKVYNTQKQIQHQIMWEGGSIHPTQKPIALYKWILEKYAKQGDKILDTHLGSGSIAIACHDYDFELTACELDKEYYDNAIKRIKNHTAQLSIFEI
jgi:site-specific DNA-methyltransferase (adenine-specific)